MQWFHKYPPPKSLSHPVAKAPTKNVSKVARSTRKKPLAKSYVGQEKRSAPKTSSISKVRSAGGAGYNLVPVENTKARSASTYNGGYSTAYKTPDGAIRGTPSTSKLVRTSSKSLPLASSTPPMPRGKVTKSAAELPLGTRVKAAFAANKGNNQAMAAKRMAIAARRG